MPAGIEAKKKPIVFSSPYPSEESEQALQRGTYIVQEKVFGNGIT